MSNLNLQYLRERYLFSPGPTHIPPLVMERMAQEPLHHRSEAFKNLFQNCYEGMRRIFQTSGKLAFISATGSGAMEAAVANTIREGEKAICVEGGKFGRRWTEISRRLGIDTIPLKLEAGESLNPERFRLALKSYSDIKAVYLTLSESSTGVLFDVQSLAKIVQEWEDIIIVVDVIGSLAADEFNQDEWGVDVAVAASQKGLMCPPGLSIVSVAPSGLGKLHKQKNLYWDLDLYFKALEKNSTPFTPAVNIFFGLEAALEMIFKRGLDNVIAETEKLAKAFRETINASALSTLPKEPSSALTVVKLPEEITDQDVINNLEARTGFRIAGGQEELSGRVIRIAHMGAVEYEDLRSLIIPLFTVLKELGWNCNPKELLEVFEERYGLY